MTDQTWRAHLNASEREEIAVLDVEIETHRTAATAFTSRREIIRRRAVQRMRKAVGK